MIKRANGGNTVPQIFIGETHVGGCDDLLRARGRRQARPAARRTLPEPQRMTATTGKFRVGLIQMRSGRTAAANLDAAVKLIGEAKSGGADYVQTPEMTNIMEIKREKFFAAIVEEDSDTSARHVPRAGARARHLRPRRLARDQGVARQGGQPRVPDRPEGRDRRALRQDPHVRRRSRERRELSRVAQLPRRRDSRWWPTCRGAGSASRSATTCASRRSTARWPRPARRSSRSRPPSPSRPARRTGTC